MPVEWVIAGLVSIVTGLTTAIGVLWKRHLDDDKRRDGELEAWKAIAQSGSTSLGDLVPAVAKLANAVDTEHKVSSERHAEIRETFRGFLSEWRETVRDIRDSIRDGLRDRP